MNTVNNFILRLDVIGKSGFILDLMNCLCLSLEEWSTVKLLLIKIVRMQPNTEKIVMAKLERGLGGSHNELFETLINQNSSAMVGRCFVDANKPIPARVVWICKYHLLNNLHSISVEYFVDVTT